ncbi:MAG: hypothetical protein FH753_10065 [Firmicutes bacterium]|nr:hypothetical protein [Bacillota bacterium]
MGKFYVFIIIIVTFVLVLSGTFYLTVNLNNLQKGMLIGSIFSILYLFVFSKLIIQINVKIFIIYSFFFVICLLSSLINQDEELFKGILILYLMYVSLGIIYPSMFPYNININKLLFLIFIFSHTPLILVSILLRGINIPYSGIFYNSNAFGSVITIICIMLFSRLSSIIDDFVFFNKNHLFKGLLLLSLLFLSFILILISNSRTSFFTVFIITFIYLVSLFIKTILKMSKDIEKLIKMMFIINLLIIFCLCFVYMADVNQLLKETIIDKTLKKSNDLLSGRGEIWKMTINEMKFFGNGREYFTSKHIAPYSTYISLLGQYGILACIIYCLFLLIMCYYSYNYILKNNKDSYRYTPLYITLVFIIMSFAEGMFFKTPMVMTYLTIGITSVSKGH